MAWLGLALTTGLGRRRARALATTLGGPAAVFGASAAHLRALGVGEEVACELREAPARAAREAAALARLDATVVPWTDPRFPARLRETADPPLVLVRQGDLDPDAPAVAIVGARRASAYGRRVAEDLAAGLASAGVVVVSGLAAGIDAAAHRGALRAGGRTVAVLATGIDRVYPAWNAGLAREIVASGAVVTEFPLGTAPLPYHFPQRNRIVSGLALATVVVEAAEQSGSLITAQCALDQGREVFAVPGPLGSALQQGPHRLIREGATLVRSAEDVLREVAPALVSAVRTAAVAGLSGEERRVLAVVTADGSSVDDVIRQAGVEASPALELLLALELRGLVRQEPGKRFRRLAA